MLSKKKMSKCVVNLEIALENNRIVSRERDGERIKDLARHNMFDPIDLYANNAGALSQLIYG